jgi:predicted ATP-grasp superfamily ATP-dependent carboligase
MVRPTKVMALQPHAMAQKHTGHVLVFGDDTRSVLSVIRSLGRAGKHVHVVPFNWQAPALRSRYIEHVHRLPRYSDDPEGWLAAVRGLIDSHRFDLLIPCCDRSMLPLDAHRGRFADVAIAMPGSEAIAVLFDKHRTRHLAQRLDIPVAPGRLLAPDDTADGLVAEFGLPLLLKAPRSYDLDTLDQRGTVDKLDTRDALEARFAERAGKPLLVEGFFEGRGVGVSLLADKGDVTHVFQHRRLHEEGTGGGSSLRISEPVSPHLRAMCARIAAELALTGVAMFEFREDETTREAVLLEVNARFWGSLPLAVASGVDFPLYLHDLLVEGRRHPEKPYRNGLRARGFLRDLHAIVAGFALSQPATYLTTLGRLLGFAAQPVGWALGREASDTFTRDDLAPAFAELLRAPTTFRHRTGRRARPDTERRSARVSTGENVP